MEIKDYRIGVYVRVAHKDDEALKRQEEYVLTYCRYRGYPDVVKVYRDNNRNNVYDLAPSSIETGMFGINIHRSNEYAISKNVNKYSAGCQVFNNPMDFKEFINIVKKSASIYGNKFTYTLITEDDL